MHEWMLDNGFTPHLVVDAKREGVPVPEAHVKDGKIVLNVSQSATRELVARQRRRHASRRVSAACRDSLSIPVAAVLGIYARETGQGMIFGEDDSPPTTPEAERRRRRTDRAARAAAGAGRSSKS